MKSINLIPTTETPSSFGMFARGHLVVLGGSVNGAKRGYADWGSGTWSPSLC